MCLYVISSVLWCPLRFPHRHDVCVCLHIVVSNTYCVVFMFCFSSSCVPYAASFSAWLSSHCFTCEAFHFALVTNMLISHQWGTDRMLITTNGTYSGSFCVPYAASFSALSIFNCPFLIAFSLFSNVYTIHIEMGCSWFNTETNKRKTSINNKNMH
jgi:hypothetical protein